MSTGAGFGGLLRHHRRQHGLSQLALALRVETTTRHLSYVENGRSRPGRELVLRLADALDLPLRSRNELLIAAGFAAEFPARPLASAVLVPYHKAIRGVMTALAPYPAFAVDPLFHLVEANAVAQRVVPAARAGERLNLLDAFLAPGPGRAMLVNFPEVAWSWRTRLSRATAGAPRSAELVALEKRLLGYLEGVPRPALDASGDPVICPTFLIDGTTVRTVGMTIRFGPSRDVTLEELSIDVLYPRDEAAEAFFRELAAT